MQPTRSQGNLAEAPSPAFYAGRTLSEVAQALLWSMLHEDPECPSRVRLDQVAQRQIPMAVSLRQVKRWRVTWGRNRRKGRPRHAAGPRPVASGAEVIRVTPHRSFVGLHLFAQWRDRLDAFGPVVVQLQQAVEAPRPLHPDDDLALLHHREAPLLCRFQALFFSPWLGIDRRTACDPHAHPLQTLLGRGSQSATLSQFLGHLARVGAAEALMPAR